MDNQKKCSLKAHSDNNAISYCQKCEIYMCNKCDKAHSDLCTNHSEHIINENINDFFTGICKEEKYHSKLCYFCKTHNKLCCAYCIVKIKGEGNGQHKDCEVCFIKEIKEEKKNKLKENIKCLKELSNSLESSINELKKLFDKINENKEELKLEIQKIFTNIRNSLNNREDELLMEVDKEFNNLFGDEGIIREGEKLPEKIKKSLEKGKILENEWKDNKLISIINDCINIENDISQINKINENINKCQKNNKIKINLYLNNDEINKLNENIKNFGRISSKIFFLKLILMKVW